MLYDWVKDDKAGRPARKESFSRREDEEDNEELDETAGTAATSELFVDVLLSDMYVHPREAAHWLISLQE